MSEMKPRLFSQSYAEAKKPQSTASSPAKKWYSGSKPTTRETIARINDLSAGDKTTFNNLYSKFLTAQNTKGSTYYNPYAKATNSKAIDGLAGLGVDVSGGITQDFLDQYAGLRNYDRTATGYSPLAPTKTSSPEQDAAYWYAQLQEAEPTTQAAEQEWAKMQKELTYWANRGLSDEEAIAKLDWGNYKTLDKMDKKKATGDPLIMNRPVGYSTDAMYGTLWAARNNGGTGNAMADMANSARGVGNVYKRDAVAEDQRNPASKNYNPYTKATIDSVLIDLGVDKIDDAWLEANHGMLATDQADLYRDLYALNEDTKAAQAEYAKLTKNINTMIERGDSAEDIARVFEEDVDNEYRTLKNMDEARRMGLAYPLADAVPYRWEDVYADIQKRVAIKRLPIEEQAQTRKDEYIQEHGDLLSGDNRETTPGSQTSIFGLNDPKEVEDEAEAWLGGTDAKYDNPIDAMREKIKEEAAEEPDTLSSAQPTRARVMAGAGASDVVFTGGGADRLAAINETIASIDAQLAGQPEWEYKAFLEQQKLELETEKVSLQPPQIEEKPDLQLDTTIADYQTVSQQLTDLESTTEVDPEVLADIDAQLKEYKKEYESEKIDETMYRKLVNSANEQLAFWRDTEQEKNRPERERLTAEKGRLEGELLDVIRSNDATDQEKVSAAATIGAWDAAAKYQFNAIKEKLSANAEYSKFLEANGGAQSAAKVLCSYVLAGEDLKNLVNVDEATLAELEKYQTFCAEALGLYEDKELYNFLDSALGGSLKNTKYNEGVGLFNTLAYGLGMGAAQFNDVVFDVAGALITGYGYMVEGSEWLAEKLGLGKSNTNEKYKQAGKDVANLYDQQYAKMDQYLLENASTLEYFTARATAEGTKMAGEFVIGTGLSGAAKTAALGTLKTGTEALKLEQTIKYLSQVPFLTESGFGTGMDTYEQTGSVLRSVVAGMASAMATAATSDLGVLSKMDDVGAPFVQSVIDKVASVPGSGAIATLKRWGVAGMQFFTNLLKTGNGEGLQEVVEYVLSEPVVYAMQEGKSFLSKGLAEIGAEATGNYIWGALSSFGATIQTFPSYARSVVAAEGMMGNGKLTPKDVVDLVEAYLADLNDPAVVAAMEKNAEQDAVEVQTGLLIAQDTGLQSLIEASEDAKEAVIQAEARVEAANAALDEAQAAVQENPAPETVQVYKEALTEQTQAAEQAKATTEQAQEVAQKAAAGLTKARTESKTLVETAKQVQAEQREAAKLERAEQKAWDREVEAQVAQPDAETEENPQTGGGVGGYFTSKFIPYDGDTPVQVETGANENQSVDEANVATARDLISQAEESVKSGEDGAKTFRSAMRSLLENAYGKLFNGQKVTIPGMTFDGQPYAVSLYKNLISKVVSDRGLTAEKLSLLPNLSRILTSAKYVGSSAVNREGQNKRLVVRYDYLTANVNIGGKDYRAAFTVEVYSKDNKFKTYAIKEMSLDAEGVLPDGLFTRGYYPASDSLTSNEVDPSSSDANSVPQNDSAVNTIVPDSTGIIPPPTNLTTERAAGSQPEAQRQFGSQTAQRSEAIHEETKRWLYDHSGYVEDSNRAQVDRAIAKIEADGYARVREAWLAQAENNLYAMNTPDNQALGVTLMGIASHQGDVESEVRIADVYNRLGTLAGQTLQARKVFDRLTPLGAVAYVQRQVDKLNAEMEAKGKTVVIKVSKEALDRIVKAETGEARQDAIDGAIKDIAKQVPPDWGTRLNAWRYLAMLGNPRTHIRNVLGNAVFMPIVGVKNKVAAAMEMVAEEAGWIDERTKALGKIDAKYKEFAAEDAFAMRDLLSGEAKYNDKTKIDQLRRSFDSKWLQTLVDKNSDLLGKEDMIFKNMYYKDALAGYLQANNLDPSNLTEAQLNKAREYAYNEALKATYQDTSEFVKALNKFAGSSKGAKLFVEGVLPFKKTPVNILKRGIEYSPVGLLNTIYKWGQSRKGKGDMSGVQFIDGLASGLTGTAAMGLGMLLSSLGFIKGNLGDDKEDDFWSLLGRQEYSVEIGDVSYTVDWMTPIAMPVLAGAALREYTSESGWSANTISKAIMATAEPIFNLSMLDGVNSLIESAQDADENGVTSAATTAVTGFLGQFIPTILGQITRVIDPVRRTIATSDKNPLPKGVQYFVGQVLNKSLFWSDLNEPYVNAWGEQEVTDSLFLRIFENMLSPGYVSNVDPDETEQALLALAKEAGDGVYPTQASKSFTVDGQKIKLSPKEYTEFKTYVGQTKKALLDEMVGMPEFADLNSKYQAKIVKDVYEYAAQTSKNRMNAGYKLDNWIATALENGTAAEALLERVHKEQTADEVGVVVSAASESIRRGDAETLDDQLWLLKDLGLSKTQIKNKISTSIKGVYHQAWLDNDIELCSRIEAMLMEMGVGFKYTDIYNWREKE